jgi:hypothetical protein
LKKEDRVIQAPFIALTFVVLVTQVEKKDVNCSSVVGIDDASTGIDHEL